MTSKQWDWLMLLEVWEAVSLAPYENHTRGARDALQG